MMTAKGADNNSPRRTQTHKMVSPHKASSRSNQHQVSPVSVVIYYLHIRFRFHSNPFRPFPTWVEHPTPTTRVTNDSLYDSQTSKMTIEAVFLGQYRHW